MTVAVLISLLVCLIPTTIGGLLSAIGIAGIDRMVQKNVLAMSGRAVEAAGDVDVLLLDKTGTITVGNRHATKFLPVGGYADTELAQLAALASAADETPEGRSIVKLAHEFNGAVGSLSAPPGSEVDCVQRADAHERDRRARRTVDPQRRAGRRVAVREGTQGAADAAV